MSQAFEEVAPLNRERLLNYFIQSCKPKANWQVGMEIEKLARQAATGRPLPYRNGSASIRSILELILEQRGGDPIYEGNHLIGIDGSWGAISLEPGGQVEWASKPRRKLRTLREDLEAHLRSLQQAESAFEVKFLDVGVEPELAVDEMEWMPKARYKIMRPYMGANGRLAHRMMTQTASIQVAYDYSSPDDWKNKFRAASLHAPLAVAMFANSARVDGQDSGYVSYRQAIWKETDPARCGIPDVVFASDFSMERWLEWILDVPSMFRHRCRGLVPSGGVRFNRMLDRTGCEALKEEDWELHLSGVFTDVRSYRYLEIRSADLLPDAELFAVPVFWTGLLYDEDVLAQSLAEAKAWDNPTTWRTLMDDAARRGLAADTGDGRTLQDVAQSLVPAVLKAVKRGAVVGAAEDADVAGLIQLAVRRGIDLEP